MLPREFNIQLTLSDGLKLHMKLHFVCTKIQCVKILFVCIMSQSIPTGYFPPPPAASGKILFERANPGHVGNFFFKFPAPGHKMMIEFPRLGQNFPKLKETPPKACKKSLRNSENYERVQIFCLENLTKLLYFRLNQNRCPLTDFLSFAKV